MSKKYSIEFTENQLRVLSRGLEFYRPVLEQFSKEYNLENPDNEHHCVYDYPGFPYSKEGRIKIEVKE